MARFYHLGKNDMSKHDGRSVYGIMVNGLHFRETSRISYERICELAGHPGQQLTVTWGRIGDDTGGILSKGMELALVDDHTFFNAYDTGQA